jgi:hypothetical protein
MPGFTPPPTWTPTPTPTDVPLAARLTWANMPADLRPVFRAYPLLPSASWTWRYTLTTGNVRWETMDLTETVDAAWLEGATAVVRSRIEAHSITGDSGGDTTVADSLPATLLRRVTSNGISHSAPPDLTELPTEAAPSEETTGAPAFVLSAWFVAHDGGVDNHVAGGPAAVVSRAGTFTGCWSTASTISAGAGALRWFCPGVGIVEYGFGVLSPLTAWSVADLIRWQRGALPER